MIHQTVYRRKPVKMPTEREEQRAFCKWFAIQYPRERLAKFHNEGDRTAAQHVILQREGLLPGTPDLFVMAARGGYHGLFIEMKRQSGGVISQAQNDVIAHLNACGYLAVICAGWLRAADETKTYMSLDSGVDTNIC